MAWLQEPDTEQAVGVSNYDNEAVPYLRDSSVAMELDNSKWHESRYAPSHTGENAYLLRYSNDQSTGDKLGRLHSCDGR